MFFACLPVAAWETERTTAEEERETSTGLNLLNLTFSFYLSPHPSHSVLVLAPLSFQLVICFSFPLSLTPKGGFSKHFHPVSSLQWRTVKVYPDCRWSKTLFDASFYWSDTVLFILKFLPYCESYTLCLPVCECASVCVRPYGPAVRFYHACLVFEFYCLSGLKRLCSYSSGMHCMYCWSHCTRRSYLIQM